MKRSDDLDGSPAAAVPALEPFSSVAPILEFDATPAALIEPSRVIRSKPVPEACVLCFFGDLVERLAIDRNLTPLAKLRSEIGRHFLYEVDVEGRRVAFIQPGVGSPLAAAMLEELIALGCRRFVACGGAGVLRPDVVLGHVFVPDRAVRDEGTSYHYLPPSREVEADPRAIASLRAVLERRGVPYEIGKTWTTDAIYRETPAKVERRRAEGCATVEMEAAALFAVARFRNVPLALLLYAGDDLSGSEWSHRGWHKEAGTREKLFWLAAEAA